MSNHKWDASVFDELQASLQKEGAGKAVDRLCALLRESQDYSGLFYALLLKKRHELGVSPVPTGASQDLPEAVHEPYEEAIREAGRMVGQLYLDSGNIPQAWVFFRMLGEPQLVAQALEQVKPGESEDIQQLVEIAYHQGVNPQKGFDWILERFGLCNAITTVSSHEAGLSAEVMEYCIKRLARALYDELRERLAADILRKEGTVPEGASVRELMAGRDWLFEDEFYHIDVSHLSSVVQLSIHLPSGQELQLVRELCAYGERLSPRFQYAQDPPFENHYRDYGVYLAILAGDEVEAGLEHFRRKLDVAETDSDNTRPAEVLVNLLLRLKRDRDALTVARKYLAHTDSRQLSCPGITELCQQTNDYKTLAEVAREQSDPVHFMAGLIADTQSNGKK